VRGKPAAPHRTHAICSRRASRVVMQPCPVRWTRHGRRRSGWKWPCCFSRCCIA